jgi:SAM-dependent methyltransferase
MEAMPMDEALRRDTAALTSPFKSRLFDFFYRTGLAKVAWHNETPSPLLSLAMKAGWLPGGARVLDVGCGFGTNTVWLAASGFRVVAIDLSSHAIAHTAERLRRAGLSAKTYQGDLLAGLDEEPFDVVFDRATLHSFPRGDARRRFARRMADLLKPQGSVLLVGLHGRVPRVPLLPPFALESPELETIFGPAFEVQCVGEEIQKHLVRRSLRLGQWRLRRRTAAE